MLPLVYIGSLPMKIFMEDYINVGPHNALGKMAPLAYAEFHSPSGYCQENEK